MILSSRKLNKTWMTLHSASHDNMTQYNITLQQTTVHHTEDSSDILQHTLLML